MGAVEDELGPKASEKEPEKAAPTRAGEASQCCPAVGSEIGHMDLGVVVGPWLLSNQKSKYQKCSSSLGF